ncbi:MAG: hypothetical protein E7355_05650, partial [Clostridiales bacterium]|nr:hypothetical protein [Clostridiales bacterium]
MKKKFFTKLLAAMAVAFTATALVNVESVNVTTSAATLNDFTTNVSVETSGDTNVVTGFSAGNYIATNASYSFSDSEVLVFETTFEANTAFTTSNTDSNVIRFSFIYGEDSVETLSGEDSKFEGHSVIGASYTAYAEGAMTKSEIAGTNTGWCALPNPGTLTYYVHADGAMDVFVNGARSAYIAASKAASNLQSAMPGTYDATTAAARVADRNGYLGWTFSGSSSIDFSYSSMKVGSTAEFAVGDGVPGSVTWLAECAQSGTTRTSTLLNDCDDAAGYWLTCYGNGATTLNTDATYIKQGSSSIKVVTNGWNGPIAVYLRDYANGNQILSWEQVQQYESLEFDIYNAESSNVNLFMYSVAAASLAPGWNAVSIPMATIIDQYNQTLADGNVTFKQYIDGQFIFWTPEAYTLYFDNVRGVKKVEVDVSEDSGSSTGGVVGTPTESGKILNRCDVNANYWINAVGGTVTVDYGTYTEGGSSFKVVTAANYAQTALYFRDYDDGDRVLTWEEVQAFEYIYMDIYNAETSTVSLWLYNCLGAALEPGWNHVKIPMTTIQEQYAQSAVQYNGGEFFVATGAQYTLFFDNIQGLGGNTGGDSGNTGGDSGNTGDVNNEMPEAIEGDVLHGCESAEGATLSWAGLENVSVSTSHVQQGNYSIKGTTISSWSTWLFYLKRNGAIPTLERLAEYDYICLTVYIENPGTFYMMGVEIQSLVPGYNTVKISGAKFKEIADSWTEGLFGYDELSGYVHFNIQTQLGTNIWVDNIVGTPGSTAGCAYTKFDDATVDSNWTLTNETVAVANGALAFSNATDAAAIVSAKTYENFVLEYDIRPTTIVSPEVDPDSGWMPVVLFGIGDNTLYWNNKFVYVNKRGEYHTLNLGEANGTLDVHNCVANQTTHVKVVAQDGVVTITFSANGQSSTINVGSGLDTNGKVGIPALGGSSFTIDNLVLINSDMFADYVVEKKTIPNSSIQASPEEILTGDLLEKLGDTTDKEISFQSLTEGFQINPITGRWSYSTGTVNGTYSLKYVITINDLVFEEWVYPLGERGRYTIEGEISVSLIGGTDPDAGTGGGAGDTSKLPEVVGDSQKTHPLGVVQNVSFVVDTKSLDIIIITYNNENVMTKAYTVTDDANGKKVTFGGNFMALLPAGNNTFSIITEKGTVEVVVNVVSVTPPTISGANSVTMKQYETTDASYTLQTNNLEILSVTRSGASKALNAQAYTYANNTLTLKKEYLSTLSVGTHTFTVQTAGGNATVKVTITAVAAPSVSGVAEKDFTVGISEDITFTVDCGGESVTQVIRNNATKALNGNAYSFNASSNALTLKKAYLSTLPIGEHAFYVSTRGGEAVVTVNVIDATAPTISGATNKTVTVGGVTNATYSISTNGQAIIAIQRNGAAKGLSNTAYTYNNGTLTLVGGYVSLLPAALHTFTLETLGGTVQFSLTVEKITLSAPVVTLDGNEARWSAIDGVVGYTYTINNGNETTTNGLSVTLKDGDTLRVKAIGDNVTTEDSSWSNAVTFTAITLSTPVVTLDGNVASWEAVENATGYVYEIDGVETETSERSVTLTDGQSIKVKAITTNVLYKESAWSNAVTFTKSTLSAPVVTLNDNVASWTAIDGATQYTYIINNDNEKTTNALSVILNDGDVFKVK